MICEHPGTTEPRRIKEADSGTGAVDHMPGVFTYLSNRGKAPVPYPWDYGLAESTPVTVEVVGRDKVPFTLDEEFATGMAVSVGSFMLRDIPYIHIPNSLLHGDFTEAGQNGDRRCWQAVELVHGEEPQEVKRMVRPHILQNPGAHTLYHLLLISVPGHDKGADF